MVIFLLSKLMSVTKFFYILFTRLRSPRRTCISSYLPSPPISINLGHLCFWRVWVGTCYHECNNNSLRCCFQFFRIGIWSGIDGHMGSHIWGIARNGQTISTVAMLFYTPSFSEKTTDFHMLPVPPILVMFYYFSSLFLILVDLRWYQSSFRSLVVSVLWLSLQEGPINIPGIKRKKNHTQRSSYDVIPSQGHLEVSLHSLTSSLAITTSVFLLLYTMHHTLVGLKSETLRVNMKYLSFAS